MKKILIIVNLLLCLTGCFNYKELNNYAIATGMAIDLSNEGYEVSFLISNSPKSNTSSSHDYRNVIYSGKGKTIYECVKQIGMISPKEIYIGHLSIVLLSEEVAKNGINESIEFLLQEPRSKKNFYIALTKNDKAKDVLAITSPLTDFPSQNIATNLKTTSHLQGSVVATDFNKLLFNTVNFGTDIYLSGFKIKGNKKDGSSEDNIESNIPKAYVELTPLAIFNKNKLVYWTSFSESKGINIINDNINNIYFNIKCKDGYIVIETDRLKTDLNIDKNKEVFIKTTGKASINEVTCDIDLNKQDELKKIEKKIEKKIKSLEYKAINKTKEYNADLFATELKYYRNYPQEYKKISNWEKLYKDINFNLNVNVKLNSTGSITQSLERMNNEKNN